MKRILIATITGLLFVASAQANSFSDNNPADVWLNALNPSYTGMFTLAGYDPAAETITSARAWFTFSDPFDGTESLKVELGGDLLTHGAFSGILILTDTKNLNVWAVLDNIGKLACTVSITSGLFTEFWMTKAQLVAESAPRFVPDAVSTSFLLGLGVICVVVAKRRFLSVIASKSLPGLPAHPKSWRVFRKRSTDPVRPVVQSEPTGPGSEKVDRLAECKQ